RKKRWRDLVHLVRRVELGLILVSFEGRRPSLEVVHAPGFFNRKSSINQGKKERTKLIDEAKNRRSNHNIVGSNNVLMMTVYKEKSIQTDYYLDYLGPMSAKDLEKLESSKNTYCILYYN